MYSDDEINVRLRSFATGQDVEGVLSFAEELGMAGPLPASYIGDRSSARQ